MTPNLDRFATQSVRYTRAFAPIGVCAPSRSTLVLGMWAPSVGTQHMRCKGTLPAEAKTYLADHPDSELAAAIVEACAEPEPQRPTKLTHRSNESAATWPGWRV